MLKEWIKNSLNDDINDEHDKNHLTSKSQQNLQKESRSIHNSLNNFHYVKSSYRSRLKSSFKNELIYKTYNSRITKSIKGVHNKEERSDSRDIQNSKKVVYPKNFNTQHSRIIEACLSNNNSFSSIITKSEKGNKSVRNYSKTRNETQTNNTIDINKDYFPKILNIDDLKKLYIL